MKKTYDVVVLGLGAMGSASALALARRGAKVCGVEQFGMAHDRGSSHGETRIIRKAYFEHPDYVPLLLRSYDLWQELCDETGTNLLNRCGLVLSGEPTSTTVSGLLRCYDEHQLPHERWSAETARHHFPRIAFPENHTVFFDPDGGFLHAERSIMTMLEQSRRLGAELLFETQVHSWKSNASGVELTLSNGTTLHAHKLVITAGAWTGRLLAHLHLPVEIWRRVLLWYGAANWQDYSPGACPVFYFETEEGGFYGFPALDSDGVKIGEHTLPEPCAAPEHVDRTLRPEDTHHFDAFVRQTFPALTPDISRHAICMYTLSPDHHFIIDQSPEQENVVFAAGFSGHGFKFAPVIGELLAGLAMEQRSDLPWEFLSLQRFREDRPDST